MHHDFSEYALVDFINKYTQGLLERTLRSDNSQGNDIRNKAQKLPNEDDRGEVNLYSKIRLPELTTETFLDTILDPSKVSQLILINVF